MTRHSYAGTTAIAGIGATAFTKNSGKSELRLAVEACAAACDDAGVDPKQVRGLSTFTMESNPENDFYTLPVSPVTLPAAGPKVIMAAEPTIRAPRGQRRRLATAAADINATSAVGGRLLSGSQPARAVSSPSSKAITAAHSASTSCW